MRTSCSPAIIHAPLRSDHHRQGRRVLLIQDYFAADQPADLVSPDGATLKGDIVTILAGPEFPGQYAQAGGAASAGKQIGAVTSLTGEASATRTDGTAVTLKIGDAVFQGDIVQTGAGASSASPSSTARSSRCPPMPAWF